ncbi:MAG: ABC transporter permease, partial [Candidatus Gracilibacteria bacterium]|nr:ABC transporter permease [Candidatus Gracilibacteria bacterium]
MLGIIIGVGSVIILTAIGNGSQKAIVDKIEELGTNILTLSPGGFRNSSISSDFLDENLIENLKNIDGIETVLPTISSNSQISYNGNSLNSSILGITTDFLNSRNIGINSGISFNQNNFDNLQKVAIIGTEVQSELFGEENSIGKNIKMGQNTFKIIGVIEENSTYSTTVFIPITTSSIRITGKKYFSQAIIIVKDSEKIEENEESINNFLIEKLNITNTNNLPYRLRNNSEMLENMSSITGTLTMLLSGIAGISLLVGGIGVMNIMLVGVTERTKEIGIRKAIGAGKNDILLQFLTESGSISVIGGIIGILFSYGVVFI